MSQAGRLLYFATGTVNNTQIRNVNSLAGQQFGSEATHRESSWTTHEEALVLVTITLPAGWGHATHRHRHVYSPCTTYQYIDCDSDNASGTQWAQAKPVCSGHNIKMMCKA